MPPEVSRETMFELRTRLQDAERGDLIGIAFVAIYRANEYHVGLVGQARLAPTFTRGTLCFLDDELAALVANQQQ